MKLACRITLPLARFTLDVDFVTERRVTGIFGRSGAGKSSLLEAIIGLRAGARGRIVFGEHTWLDGTRASPPEARDVGYVPQAGMLFPHLTAGENLSIGARRAARRGLDVDALRARVVDTLELAPLLTQPAHALSGGERQRVALARALCSGPKLLVLDEPLASLDIAMQRKLLPFLRRVRESFDVPMLLVSHAPLEIAALTEHVIALEEGRIVASGAPSDVLAASPIMSEEGGRLRSVFAVDDVRAEGARLAGTDVRIATRARDAGTWIAIPADAVILARTAPTDTTAANVLPARVEGVDAHGEHVIVRAAIADGHPPLLAEVTRASCERLGIAAGMDVTVIVKASSVEVL